MWREEKVDQALRKKKNGLRRQSCPQVATRILFPDLEESRRESGGERENLATGPIPSSPSGRIDTRQQKILLKLDPLTGPYCLFSSSRYGS